IELGAVALDDGLDGDALAVRVVELLDGSLERTLLRVAREGVPQGDGHRAGDVEVRLGGGCRRRRRCRRCRAAAGSGENCEGRKNCEFAHGLCSSSYLSTRLYVGQITLTAPTRGNQ